MQECNCACESSVIKNTFLQKSHIYENLLLALIFDLEDAEAVQFYHFLEYGVLHLIFIATGLLLTGWLTVYYKEGSE